MGDPIHSVEQCPHCKKRLLNGAKCDCTWHAPSQNRQTTSYLIRYPKGQGEDLMVQGDHLTLDITHGWAVLADQHGPCIAVPAHSGATITRIDQDQQPEE